MSNIVSISQVAAKASKAIKRTYTESELGENVVDEVMELSIYPPVHIADDQQREAYHACVVNECARLMAAFPMRNDQKQQSFYSILYGGIEDSKMSPQRLHDSINRLIREHKYAYFTAADILSFDSTIILTTTIDALKRKIKYLKNENIVVVYGMVNGIQKRMYGIRDEVENSPYAKRIIGVWNADKRCFDWIGSFDDPTIPARKQAFKESLFKFCNTSTYGGKYDVDLLKAFYEYYTQVLMPGDTLLFESFMSFETETFIDNFKNKYYENQS